MQNVSKVGPLKVSRVATLNVSNWRDPLNEKMYYAKRENNNHRIEIIKT